MKFSDIMLIVSLVHLFAYYAGRHWEILAAFAVSVGVNFLVKRIVKKPRPGFLGELVSFYSGHTATAFIAVGALLMYESWVAVVAALVLAVLVGWGRIHERQHDIKDVTIGAAAGTFYGAVVPMILQAVQV